jgi:hypothetical protein
MYRGSRSIAIEKRKEGMAFQRTGGVKDLKKILALPKLVRKSLDVRSLNREIHKMNKKIAELEKGHIGGFQIA